MRIGRLIDFLLASLMVATGSVFSVVWGGGR
jgi:hypothetical protein